MSQKKNQTSLLRKLREAQFKTLTEFCEKFEKKMKERLPQPTMSLYETGKRMSSRRLDLIAEFLQISKKDRMAIEAEMGGGLVFRSPHKEYEMKVVRQKKGPRKTSEPTTVSVRVLGRVANTTPRKRKSHQSDTARYKMILKNLASVGVDTDNDGIKILAFQMALVK